MKILVVFGGSLAEEKLLSLWKEIFPKHLRGEVPKPEKTTSFIGHEIFTAEPSEALATYLETNPERIIFAGVFDKGMEKGTSRHILIRRMLVRSMGGDKRKFALTNPLPLPPFMNEENFFKFADIDGMAQWFGLDNRPTT